MSNCTIINSDQAGRDGLSNYELAIRTGAFSGTEAEYIEWIRGQKGDPGESGVINNASAMTLPPESPASANIEDLGGQKILVLGIPKGETGPPGERGIPGLDGIDGIDGNNSFRSTIFIRTNSTPATPVGGSYAQPIPVGWNDGIPAGEEQIWMSTRVFSSNGSYPQQESWTTPRPTSDTSVLDYEVSDVEIPGNPTDNPENWRDASTGSPSDIWLAIRNKHNGVWSSWTILKIKGESGADGVDGSAGLIPEIRYAVNGSFTVPPAISNSDRDPYGWSVLVPSASVGQYIWVTTALINPETDQLANLWNNPSRFTGQPGEKGDKGEDGEKGDPGDEGPRGASLMYRGDWKDTSQYNGSISAVDFVTIGVAGSRLAYIARTDAGAIPIGTPVTDTDYWNGPIENADAIFTDFFIAYSAYIDNLTVGQVRTNPEAITVPDPISSSESTAIGFQPSSPVDPTSQEIVFSRHGIRQYHPSGRISMYMGPVNGFTYEREVDGVPSEASVDGWAIITFKDDEDSSVFFVLDSASLNGVRYSKVGADSYTPMTRIVIKNNTSALTQSDINSIFSGGTWRYNASVRAKRSQGGVSQDYDVIFHSFNIARQGQALYQFTPGTGSSLTPGITTNLSGTYFNGWIITKITTSNPKSWTSNNLSCNFNITLELSKVESGVITETATVANGVSVTRSYLHDNFNNNPPFDGQVTGVPLASLELINVPGADHSASTGSGTFGFRGFNIDHLVGVYSGFQPLPAPSP